MCLITTKRKVKIAKRDIKVWKIVNKRLERYYSPYQGFEYREGVLYESELAEKPTGKMWNCFDYIDSEFLANKYGEWQINDEGKEKLMCIEKGFHSALTKKRLAKLSKRKYSRFTMEFTIPKGSEYYKDESGCIVSNQIIMK